MGTLDPAFPSQGTKPAVFRLQEAPNGNATNPFSLRIQLLWIFASSSLNQQRDGARVQPIMNRKRNHVAMGRSVCLPALITRKLLSLFCLLCGISLAGQTTPAARFLPPVTIPV